jgi:PAS domain S-box-containing protein
MQRTRRSIRYFFLSLARWLRDLGQVNPIASSRAEARQQGALFRLSADLAESLDADEIYARLVKGLHDTLGYTFVSVYRVNASNQHRILAAAAGYAKPQSPLKPGMGLSEGPVLDGRLHYTADVTQQDSYLYGAGGSEVDVPITIGGEVVAVLIAENRLPDAFVQADLDALDAAANIAGLALEKAQLIQDEMKRVDQLEALRITTREILGELELDQLLHSILERASALLGADGGELGLVEDDSIRIVASYNFGNRKVGRLLNIGEGLMGIVAQSGEPMLVADYQQWTERLPDYSDIHSTLCVPLKVAGKTIGCFTTARFDGKKPFSEDDLDLLRLFAQQAVVAVENARLFEQSQREIERRREAQLELRNSREYYKALFMNNPQAVVVADVDGNITSWNPSAEELFGYSFADVDGRNLDLFLAADERLIGEAKEYTERVLHEGLVHKDVQRTRKDGSLVDVEVLSLPIFVEEKLEGFIAIYHDLTEIKEAQDALLAHNHKMGRELELAGKIQRGFMDSNLPEIPGWDLSAILRPANETSGDFYSIRALPDGQIAILIADVVDKGVGAALTMALTWSLFRVTPLQVGPHPSKVFAEVSTRLIKETKSDQFLTAFYAVLDPESGKLTYCNAGHNAPLLQTLKAGAEPEELIRTGMPLGVSEDEEWQERTVQIRDDQLLLMYTDGLSEGLNPKEEFYGEDRIKRVLKGKRRISAKGVRKAILESFDDFVGAHPQSDDLALIIIRSA